MTREVVRVGIIGAGASGLAQLKQLLEVFDRPDVKSRADLEVVVFEKQAEVGGVWFADEDAEKQYRTAKLPTEAGANGHSEHETGRNQVYVYPPEGEDPSPMYEGLRTNLPHDLMAFRSLPMPASLPTFPTRAQIQDYLVSYAQKFHLYPHIKFESTVRRLYQSQEGGRRWAIEYADRDGQVQETRVDFVCCANGHYADGWIPQVPGLSTFEGKVLHSRYFRSAEDHAGQKVLVVGSFASGGDISRLLAAYNLGSFTWNPKEGLQRISNGHYARIDVHISCSSITPFSVNPNDRTTPWGKYVTYHPIIERVSPDTIHFEDGTTLGDVDTIIYATGYNFALPFAKAEDKPWCDTPIFNGQIGQGEREGGEAWEAGGLKGLGVRGLDELMLFLEGDRSICFPVLQYQVVPFPLAETQTRLSSLLWADLLPSFPQKPVVPRNASNPYSAPPPANGNAEADGTNPTSPLKPSHSAAPRKVVQTRQKLVFGSPYEWEYQEFLMSIMREAEPDAEDCWKGIEKFRRDRRADTGLRKRTLGY